MPLLYLYKINCKIVGPFLKWHMLFLKAFVQVALTVSTVCFSLHLSIKYRIYRKYFFQQVSQTIAYLLLPYLFNFRMATFRAEKSGLSSGSSLQHLVIMLMISSSAESLSTSGRRIPFEVELPLAEVTFPAVLQVVAFAAKLPLLPPPSNPEVLPLLRTPSTISVKIEQSYII